MVGLDNTYTAKAKIGEAIISMAAYMTEERIMIPVRIGALNRITVPIEIRKILKVEQGQYLVWRVQDNDKITIETLD